VRVVPVDTLQRCARWNGTGQSTRRTDHLVSTCHGLDGDRTTHEQGSAEHQHPHDRSLTGLPLPQVNATRYRQGAVNRPGLVEAFATSETARSRARIRLVSAAAALTLHARGRASWIER
jgi:hypothetical protein